MTITVPDSVEQLLTADVADEIAQAYGDQPVFPARIVVDSPSEPSRPGAAPARRFPDWPGSVLVLSDENQGACSWGVPLDSRDPRVLVGGDLDTGPATVPYAASVADFIAVRRWDRQCATRTPYLLAQAPGLERDQLRYLQERLAPGTETVGWPGPRQYRFEDARHDVRVMLWSGPEQCDWCVSGSRDALRVFTTGLLALPGLSEALWSNDPDGARVLSELRGQPSHPR